MAIHLQDQDKQKIGSYSQAHEKGVDLAIPVHGVHEPKSTTQANVSKRRQDHIRGEPKTQQSGERTPTNNLKNYLGHDPDFATTCKIKEVFEFVVLQGFNLIG